MENNLMALLHSYKLSWGKTLFLKCYKLQAVCSATTFREKIASKNVSFIGRK